MGGTQSSDKRDCIITEQRGHWGYSGWDVDNSKTTNHGMLTQKACNRRLVEVIDIHRHDASSAVVKTWGVD